MRSLLQTVDLTPVGIQAQQRLTKIEAQLAELSSAVESGQSEILAKLERVLSRRVGDGEDGWEEGKLDKEFAC